MKRVLVGTLFLIGLLLLSFLVFYEKFAKTNDNENVKIISYPPEASSAENLNQNNQTFVLSISSEALRLNAIDQTPEEDLAIVSELLREYRRQLGRNPVGDNDEITSALLGKNSKSLACLPKGPAAYLDAAGRLIDRWGTPYFFHALSGSEMEIISAGPDREFHTADDLRHSH